MINSNDTLLYFFLFVLDLNQKGTLVKALRSGDWVLLDEINLASADMLECLSGLLESPSGSVVLTERGCVE